MGERAFKDGRTNVHDEERCGRPSVINEDLMQKVDEKPRAHESGGIYGRGVIVRRYIKGATFSIRVEITANHRGHFEFRLCKHNAPDVAASQDCLDRNVLKRAKSTVVPSPNDRAHPTWYYVGAESKVYEMRYTLPPDVTCSQCVLQWRYVAGNNWGRCENSSNAVGCGPQEEFRACADIAISDEKGNMDHSAFEELVTEHDYELQEETTTKNISDNNPTTTAGTYRLPLYIVISAMFSSIVVYVLLFIYFYGTYKNIEPVWKTTMQSPIKPEKTIKILPEQPLTPPRSKRSQHLFVV